MGGIFLWIYLFEEYFGGVRIIFYFNLMYIFKFIDDGIVFLVVDSFWFDFNILILNGYNYLFSKNRVWFFYEFIYDLVDNWYFCLFKFIDVDIIDLYLFIVVLDILDFGDYGINWVNMYNFNYNGEIVWYLEEDEVNNIVYVGVIG